MQRGGSTHATIIDPATSVTRNTQLVVTDDPYPTGERGRGQEASGARATRKAATTSVAAI